MKEKKKHDELLAETPEARQPFSITRGRQASTAEDGPIELRDLIAQRAFEIYEERGRCDGEDLNDWLRAEAEVNSSITAEKWRPLASGAGAGQ